MKISLREVLASIALAAALLGVTACCNTEAHPESTAKCSSSATGDLCKTCCSAQGRNGHTFISGGSGCKCL